MKSGFALWSRTNREGNGRRHEFQESQRAREQVQLLLNLTNRITANLELREVLRAISANIREVMHCDAAAIFLPGAEAGTSSSMRSISRQKRFC